MEFTAREISSQGLHVSAQKESMFHEESLQIFELPAERSEVVQCNSRSPEG